MAYEFRNTITGQAKIVEGDSSTNISIKGINTQNNNADAFMDALTTLLGVVGWTVEDAQRIVTQDVEEV